jgi:uncharacterized protein YqgV (UPF0045/DUF77 family)
MSAERGELSAPGEVRAQVSLYPLRQSHLGPAIESLRAVFAERGIAAEVGAMSTQVAGDCERLFAALRDGFERAAAAGDVVMVVTISNCCAAPR